MRKFIYISLIFMLVTTIVSGQQSPHYTQYMFNDFVINPAIAGTKDYYQISSNHRFQWMGIVDPPLTNTLSINGPHGKLPMGFGGYVYNDVTGPTSQTGITGAYAYNVEVFNDIRVSGGISAGLMQYKVDGSQLTVKDASDVVIQPIVYNAYVPDFGFGFYAYADEWYAGLSVSQLINNKLNLLEEPVGVNMLKRHFYLTGGYKYEINRDLIAEPSIIIKGTAPKVYQFDITARVIWQEIAWGGVSYRLNDAISVLLGYIYDEQFYFGYAYDIGVSNFRKFNSGSHEIMIGFKFNDIK